jgi:hypothetical protein
VLLQEVQDDIHVGVHHVCVRHKHLKENNLILVQINTSPKYLVGSHTFV